MSSDFMATLPCPAFLPCSPCPDGDPSANLSAEAPDIEKFFAIVVFQGDPPLGTTWSQLGCKTLCESTISQEDADLCALRQAQECTWGTWRTPPTILHPNGTSVRIFSNSAQECSVNCPDGTSFTKLVPPGTVLALTQAEADFKAFNLACKQAQEHIICLTDIQGFACQNTFYDQDIGAIAGPQDINVFTSTWNIVAGTLPPGLTLVPDPDPFIASIQGTPTVMGTYVFTVQVTLDNGDTQEKTYSITVGGIATSSNLPDATVGAAYSKTLTTTGMTGSPVWSIVVGTLPDGLTLDPITGIISGTPTAGGTFALTIQAQDSASNTCTKAFTIKVTSITPFAWYKMEEANDFDRVDQVAGNNLHAVNMNRAVGKILFASNFSVVHAGDSCALIRTASVIPGTTNDFTKGFGVSFWFNFQAIADLTTAGPYLFALTLANPANVILDILQLFWTPTTLKLEATNFIDPPLDLIVPFTPTLGTWYYCCAFWDGVTKKISLRINATRFDSGPTIAIASPTNIKKFVLDSNLTADPVVDHTVTILLDEMGLVSPVPSNADMDFLYNGGAGRTYPF